MGWQKVRLTAEYLIGIFLEKSKYKEMVATPKPPSENTCRLLATVLCTSLCCGLTCTSQRFSEVSGNILLDR